MKILFVSAMLPYPLYSGGQVRIYNLLKLLSKKHDITLFTFLRDLKERQYISELSFCKSVVTVYRGRAWQPKYIVKSLITSYPLLFTTYNNKEMRAKLVRELTKEYYDLIHLEPGYVWPAIPETNIPIVVSEHNIESHIYTAYISHLPIPLFRPILSLDVAKLSFWQQYVWKKAKHVLSVSTDDANEIKHVVGSEHVSIIPNGVDLTSFPYRPKEKVSENPTFLFVGNFTWIQNQDAMRFLLKLWPHILAKYPRATLRIVGKKMPSSLKQKAKTQNIQIAENVSDITQEYQKADIMLAPIRVGGGTKFKILEAMASGIPVITTTIGAKGIEVQHMKELCIADTTADTLEAIDMSFTKVRQDLVKNARKCIEKNYSWIQIAKKLDTVWQSYR